VETHKASWRRRTVAAASAALLLVPSLGVSPAAATTGTWYLEQSTTLQEDHTGNIVIETDNVTLDCAGHTVRGPGTVGRVAGVFIDGASGVTVKRCVITGFEAAVGDNGIFVRDSSAVTISGTKVTGNAGQGIVLQRSDDGVVMGNRATGNGANGIHTTESDGVIVSGNTVTGNAEHGIHILWAEGGTVVANTSRSNGSLAKGGGGIVISASTQILVTGNTAVENTIAAGIALGIGTTASTVVDNTSNRNAVGFEVTDSSGNTLQGNSANGNAGHGFLLWDSDENVLTENTANGNHDEGFLLVGADANELARNTANSNNNGFIAWDGASYNTFTRNVARANDKLDAGQADSCTGNTWLNNNFRTTGGI